MTSILDIMQQRHIQALTRRTFLGGSAAGLLGGLYMQSAFASEQAGSPAQPAMQANALAATAAHFAPKAKRVIAIHLAGGPSQLELFEHKPELTKFDGKDCPQSFLEGKRFAFISGVPKLMGTLYPFAQHGDSGAWVSDRLPYLAQHVDDLCFIKSMRTDQFNHGPAQLLFQTGHAQPGHAALGSWVNYGLGSENQNLPGFVVLSGGGAPSAGKQAWGAGYLPSVYQGVECRSQGEPVLYLNNPDDLTRTERRRVLDAISAINQESYEELGNPETLTRISQYEMAYRMQLEASDAMDITLEQPATLARYGAEPGKASFANNCVVARRLAERDVRFIQLYDSGWDSHAGLDKKFVEKCKETDQPVAALLADLKERGLLEDTLVIWGGEFGRTPMRENRGGQEKDGVIGRDHHPSAFTIWMCGGGVKQGYVHGETDELGYEIARDPVEVRDLHATILYQLGFDHHKLNFPYQGLEQKLTGVKPARVVGEILA